ncbi:M23 family metallopeptidase [Methylobacterium sp. ID0610]|uniref:M23 family metallopeptidase n=1 Tax=Methylobacterium carpenticola TaxID=3344827 RepID=UPI0036A56604
MQARRILLIASGLVLASLEVRAEAFRLQLPLACEPGRTCFVQHHVDHDPGPEARDYAGGPRTYDRHDGTDFRLTSGVAAASPLGRVRAAAAGTVLRIRNDAPDVSVRESGIASVEGVECGNGLVVAHPDGYETQYCHLARGSLRVRPGEAVAAGQEIGQVGLSGASEFPHLHFTVRRAGRILDPFAPEGPGTGAGDSLWDEALRGPLAYQAGTILNAGFSDGPVSMAAVEAETTGTAGAQADALVAWVRVIGLDTGDVQSLVVRTPDGRVLSAGRQPPLAKPRAQSLMFVGKKRPAGGWPAGTYVATFSLLRAGRSVAEHSFSVRLPPP